MCILAINCGSSSLKYALYEGEALILRGKIADSGIEKALETLFESIKGQKILAVGHRIVHGGPQFIQPCAVTAKVMKALKSLSPFDPDHLPDEIRAIESAQQRYPEIPQVACFDTAFHAAMPPVAKYYPIPRRLWSEGVYHYGFHGLSYEYVMQVLKKKDPQLALGKIVIAHLGNGASMAAVKGGVSIDTSMGFTPICGLMMGTRTGDLDPGVLLYLQRKMGMTLEEINRLLNKEGGLLAVSSLSSNMQELLEAERSNPMAAEAVAMFCYRAKKYLGAYQAAMGGLDSVIFTGGIGENSSVIRERICLPGVPAQVVPTNEEWVIAQHTRSEYGAKFKSY